MGDFLAACDGPTLAAYEKENLNSEGAMDGDDVVSLEAVALRVAMVGAGYPGWLRRSADSVASIAESTVSACGICPLNADAT